MNAKHWYEADNGYVYCIEGVGKERQSSVVCCAENGDQKLAESIANCLEYCKDISDAAMVILLDAKKQARYNKDLT